MQRHTYFAFALLLSATAEAQVSFGVQAGAVFSRMDIDLMLAPYDADKDRKLDMAFGTIADVPLSNMFALQPELAYRRKGYMDAPNQQGNFIVPPGSPTLRWTYDYLDVTLLLRFKPFGEDRALSILAGPSVSRLLGIRVRNPEAPAYDPDNILQPLQSPTGVVDPGWLGYAMFDVGFNAGIGFWYSLGATKLAVDIRYQHGLVDVHDGFILRDINLAPVGPQTAYSRAWMLNVAWLLPVRQPRTTDAGGA